jgi:hypothetical protein
MLSAQGNSKTLGNGMFVSQTIGQQSVIGNHKSGITISQGFQQSHWNKYLQANFENQITITTYPNPFISTVNFLFSKSIKEFILITVFDINGRLIFKEEKKTINSIITIELPQLKSGNYLVRLTTSENVYYSQIIKK